jgi:cobalt-zinc-cadmium efflux system protein
VHGRVQAAAGTGGQDRPVTAHDHAHGHGADDRRRLVVVLVITSGVLLAELVGGLVTGSLALLADAGHVLTDAAGLLIAVVGATLALRPATATRTWGYRRAEVLAATLQAAVLLAVGVLVLVEGVRRLVHPPDVAAGPMGLFGLVGLAGNVAALLVLLRAPGRSFLTRAALLEVGADALGAVAVVGAAAVIALTGELRADPAVSVLVGLLILPRTLRLLRDTAEVLLEATPRGLDLLEVRAELLRLPHVHGVHDLHATSIAAGLPVVTAHVVLDDSCFSDGHAPQVLDQLQACLAAHAVSVEHSTFQLEPASHTSHEEGAHA